MNGNNKPYAILVFGAPVSGKTQFAEQFSKQFKAPLLNVGDLIEKYDLSRPAVLELIRQVALSGQNFMIEGGVDTEKERMEIREMLRKAGYRPTLIWVQTDLATIKRRLKMRLKSVEKAKATFEDRYRALEAPADSENPIVISGKHTFEAQLKTVLTHLAAPVGKKQ